MGWGPEQRVQGFQGSRHPTSLLLAGDDIPFQEDLVSPARAAFKGASISFAPSDSPLAHSVRHLCRVVEGSGGSDEKTGFALILENLHVEVLWRPESRVSLFHLKSSALLTNTLTGGGVVQS
jgi:hypothetical protein